MNQKYIEQTENAEKLKRLKEGFLVTCFLGFVGLGTLSALVSPFLDIRKWNNMTQGAEVWVAPNRGIGTREYALFNDDTDPEPERIIEYIYGVVSIRSIPRQFIEYEPEDRRFNEILEEISGKRPGLGLPLYRKR